MKKLCSVCLSWDGCEKPTSILLFLLSHFLKQRLEISQKIFLFCSSPTVHTDTSFWKFHFCLFNRDMFQSSNKIQQSALIILFLHTISLNAVLILTTILTTDPFGSHENKQNSWEKKKIWGHILIEYYHNLRAWSRSSKGAFGSSRN